MEIIPVDPMCLLNLAECEQKVLLFVLAFIFFEHTLRAVLSYSRIKSWTEPIAFYVIDGYYIYSHFFRY